MLSSETLLRQLLLSCNVESGLSAGRTIAQLASMLTVYVPAATKRSPATFTMLRSRGPNLKLPCFALPPPAFTRMRVAFTANMGHIRPRRSRQRLLDDHSHIVNLGCRNARSDSIVHGRNAFHYLTENSASSFRMALSMSLRTVSPTSSSNSFCNLSKALMTRRAHFFPCGFKVSW